MLASLIVLRASVQAATTPAPLPPDDPSISPGFVGFLATFLVAVAAVLLILDMVRRVRRVNYRAQVREQLEAEQAASAEDPSEFSQDVSAAPDAVTEPAASIEAATNGESRP